jgi:hypothetical protein
MAIPVCVSHGTEPGLQTVWQFQQSSAFSISCILLALGYQMLRAMILSHWGANDTTDAAVGFVGARRVAGHKNKQRTAAPLD